MESDGAMVHNPGVERVYGNARVTIEPDADEFVVTIAGGDTQVKWIARGRTYPTVGVARRCLKAVRVVADDAPDLACWSILDPFEPDAGAVLFMGSRQNVKRAIQLAGRKVHRGKPLELNENVVWTLVERRLDRFAATPPGEALRFDASHDVPVFLQSRQGDEPPPH
jgi:hypothetical protein